MKIVFLRTYKKVGTKGVFTMFVYAVTGTTAELAKFKEAQGEHYRESEEKEPLYFSNKYVGEEAKLIITSKGKVVPDTSETDKAASLAKQYGGDFGSAIANALAAKIVNSQTAPAPVKEQEHVDETLD